MNLAPADADISSGWTGNAKYRTLAAGDTKELKLHFKERASVDAGAYRIVVLPE